MTDKPLGGQIELPNLASWYGKTSRALYQAPEATEKARTSAPSSKKLSKSLDRTRPIFLYLTADAGQNPALSWAEAPTESLFPLLTDYTTPSFGESPSEENASRLSSILEASPLPKYCLSAKACEGILNRAKKRGKVLPEALALALKAQSVSKNAPENPGGGKGILIQAEHVGALSTFNNQSVFCLQGNGIDRALTAGCNGKGWTENVSYTLNTIDRPAVVYDVSRRHDIHDMGETCETIRANYGTGGLNTPVICGQLTAGQAKQRGDTPLIYGASSLGNYAPQVSPLRAAGGDNGGDSENLVCSSAVRRLTPLECERLQGFPDGWTDIGAWTDTRGRLHKESSDAARYKALGNSIALPFWFWLLRRIAAQYERPATLGSLFDGIGGFPLCWERCNGPGTARWASEIEEFPIAVTKAHFPEPGGGSTNASE